MVAEVSDLQIQPRKKESEDRTLRSKDFTRKKKKNKLNPHHHKKKKTTEKISTLDWSNENKQKAFNEWVDFLFYN